MVSQDRESSFQRILTSRRDYSMDHRRCASRAWVSCGRVEPGLAFRRSIACVIQLHHPQHLLLSHPIPSIFNPTTDPWLLRFLSLPSCKSALTSSANRSSPAWQKLEAYHKSSASSIVVKDLFGKDKDRFSKLSRKFEGKDGGILFDFSKNLVDDQSYKLLLQLADEAKVFQLRDRLFAGEHINITEDRLYYQKRR